MKKLRFLSLTLILAVLCNSTVMAFHAPPWDTGHQSFSGDPGENDNDPGDDACPPNTCGSKFRGASPVEFASGDFTYSLPVLLIKGLGPFINFALTYHSRDERKGSFGRGWVHSYDRRLIETTDGVDVYAIYTKENGKRERFKRKADGSYLPPAHLVDVLTKNSDGTFALREHTGATYRFDSSGWLTSVVDRNSNALNLIYDAAGFLIRITDASGRAIIITKGADGRAASLTDPANRTFRFAYDTSGNLTRYTDALGNATNYQYDSKNNLATVQDPRGNVVTRLTYDSQGRVATHVDGAETWTYTYQPTQKRTTKRDSQNNTWTFDYNAAGVATKRTDPIGSTELYTYNANLNLTQSTDKNGNKTTFTYDNLGNTLTITDALGKVWTMTYEPNFNRVQTVTDPRGGIARIEYDARGNATKLTNALGHVTQYQYDAKGQVTRITDAMGKSSTLTYDPAGNLTSSTSPMGDSASSFYDVLGRLVSYVDGEGRTTQFTYDDADRVTRTVNAQAGTTAYQYDASGNLIAITKPSGARTSFEYDSLNRLVKRTNPLNQFTSMTYTKRDKLASLTTAVGQVINYSYDPLDRLTRKVKPEETVNYAYDRQGNILSLQDSDSNLSYVYDGLNRITEARTAATAGQPASLIKFTYDMRDNRDTLIDPQGGTTRYTYDVAARLTSITTASSETFSFTYDSLSRRTGLTRGALSTSYAYDAAGRLVNLTHQGGPGPLQFSYTYNRAGSRKSLADSAGSHVFELDSLYRLTGASHPSGQLTESFTYDPVGNRTSSHLSNTYQHNAADRLTADAVSDYIYDANGNLTRKTERSTAKITNYTYDSENQLTRIDFPDGTSTSYRYDGFGRRIEKKIGGQAVQYVYDGQDVLAEYAGSTLTALYTHGPGVDEMLSVRRGGVTAFFQSDGQGSVARVVEAGATKVTYTYDSFGRIVTQAGTSHESYTFQGREFNRESGLYYFRARYYDPQAGRFISEDPIGFQGGLNFYAFVKNNPVTLTDPTGLYPGEDIIEFFPDAIGADFDFWRNYWNMREAKTHGADKYFHCKANCEAARRGPGGQLESWLVSESRELWDQYGPKQDPASACDEDRRANNHGRQSGSNDRAVDCSQACSGFRPGGLDPKY